MISARDDIKEMLFKHRSMRGWMELYHFPRWFVAVAHLGRLFNMPSGREVLQVQQDMQQILLAQHNALMLLQAAAEIEDIGLAAQADFALRENAQRFYAVVGEFGEQS